MQLVKAIRKCVCVENRDTCESLMAVVMVGRPDCAGTHLPLPEWARQRREGNGAGKWPTNGMHPATWPVKLPMKKIFDIMCSKSVPGLMGKET